MIAKFVMSFKNHLLSYLVIWKNSKDSRSFQCKLQQKKTDLICLHSQNLEVRYQAKLSTL